MFYTITFSPSVDLLIETKDDFKINGLTRYENSLMLAGGKGINASIILKRLNFETTAITFLNGSFSKIIQDQLNEEKINLISLPSKNETRVNIKFNNQIDNFEINGPLSIISKKTKEKLMELISNLKKEDVVFIMGRSDMDLVEEIVKELNQKEIKFVLDIDSKRVLNLLKYKPFAIKPNLNELETLIERKINSEDEIINSAKNLLERGLQNLIISCAEKGSYFVNKNKILKIETPNLKIVNSAGAGDSMLSTFVAHYIKSNNEEESFVLSNAAGMATVSSKWLGTKKQIDEFKSTLKVVSLK